MRCASILLVHLLIPVWCCAQTSIPVGAAQISLGSPGLSEVSGIGSLQMNSSNATCYDYLIVGASARNHYWFPNLSSSSLFVSIPSGSFSLSVLAVRFGNELLQEYRTGIGIAQHKGIGRMGIRLDYLRKSVEGRQDDHALNLQVSGGIKLGEALSVYAAMNDFRLSGKTDHPANLLSLSIEVVYSAEAVALLYGISNSGADLLRHHVGLQYEVRKPVVFRAGYASGTNTIAAGIGTNFLRLTIDMGIEYHPALGSSLASGVSYRW